MAARSVVALRKLTLVSGLKIGTTVATVLAFLQKERGLLKPGYRFQPTIRDDVLRNFDAKKLMQSTQKTLPAPTTSVIIDPADPTEEKSDAPEL